MVLKLNRRSEPNCTAKICPWIYGTQSTGTHTHTRTISLCNRQTLSKRRTIKRTTYAQLRRKHKHKSIGIIIAFSVFRSSICAFQLRSAHNSSRRSNTNKSKCLLLTPSVRNKLMYPTFTQVARPELMFGCACVCVSEEHCVGAHQMS